VRHVGVVICIFVTLGAWTLGAWTPVQLLGVDLVWGLVPGSYDEDSSPPGEEVGRGQTRT
jgi:hypothetical protein